MKVSFLMCSIKDSPYMKRTIDSFSKSFPGGKDYELEILADIEEHKTGLKNTTNRYMKLFEKSKGDIIIKSDDDVEYLDNKWFEYCLNALLKEAKAAYISPISHVLMKEIGIQHANSDKLPIDSHGEYREENVLSGMAWVFRRTLWQHFPYTLAAARSWRLDGEYARIVHSKKLKTIALIGGHIKHLGGGRYKGIPTDRSGEMASTEFQVAHPEVNFTIT